MSVTAKSVSTTATLLFSVRVDERPTVIVDNQGDYTVFIGDEATVTASSGVALEPEDVMQWDFSDATHLRSVTFAVYGITSSGTCSVRVMVSYL
jgi:hypothetical protein